MGQRQDQVGAGLDHLGHPGAGGADDVAREQPAIERVIVPVDDLRRGKADHPDADRMRDAHAIGHLTVEQHIGFDQGSVAARIGPKPGRQVRRHHRAGCAVDRPHQEIEAIVEFVIAQRDRVEVERVHRGDDRMHVAVAQAAFMRDIIAHRRALQEITIVEEQRIRRFGPGLFDQPCGADQADALPRTVGIIVIGKQVQVQVGGLDDPQMHATLPG